MSIAAGNGASGAPNRSNRTLSIGRPLLDGAVPPGGRDRAASGPGEGGHVPLAEAATKNKLGTLLGVYLPWYVA